MGLWKGELRRTSYIGVQTGLMCLHRSWLPLFLFASVLMVNCHAQNEVCLSIEDNPFATSPGFSGFDRSVHVLDCFHVIAEPGISDAKLLHVAAVVAELLDQDEDGIADDAQLQGALADGGALMPVLEHEGSDGEEDLMEWYDGDGIAAVLYEEEIDPSQTGYWGSDATVEEVLHTINSVGHVTLFPEAFSPEPNSSLLTEAMDVARGGQFLTLPNPYPEEAWFHYDDWTCDYECMAIEYLYWAIVAEMGLLDDPWIAEGISDEWELTSPEQLEAVDVLIHALITDPQYGIPLQAPDGNYCPLSTGVGNQAEEAPVLTGVVDLMGRRLPLDAMRSGAHGWVVGLYSDGSSRLLQVGVQ